jgi:putative membrane protein
MARSQRDALLLAGVLIAAVVLLGPLLMGGLMALVWSGTAGGMGPGAMGGMGGGVVLAALFVLLPLLLVGLVVVWAWRQFGDGDDPAREELRMALARGDISEEEYERRREMLEERD